MSGLNILGGIGQGVQKGVSFMQQKQQQDEAMRMNQARLAMLEEQQGWERQKQKEADAEKQRLGMVDKILQEEMLTYQEQTGKPELDRLDLAEVHARAGQKAFQSGFLPATELAKAQETQRQLRESGVADLYLKTAFNDDWNSFNKGFSQISGGATAKPVGENIVVTGPDGRQTPFSRIGFESLLKMDLTAGAQKTALEQQKTQAELDKTRSETDKNRAIATKERAEAGKARVDARTGRTELTSDAKNAKYMVQIGLAKDEADAWQQIQRDGNLRYVLSVMANNPRALANPQKAFEEARAMVESRQPAAGAQTGAAPADGIPTVRSVEEARKLPKGTKFRAPDGTVRIVP